MNEQEIMTVEEVAEYLRVSERTIYDWAQKGEIPSGKLGTAWRFKRSEIQKWVDRRLDPNGVTSQQVSATISGLLPPERILLLDCSSKAEVLNALIDCLAKVPEITDRDSLASAVFEREELMSTGMGLGIAVPHVRLPWLDTTVMAACVCKRGIEDYVSLDGQPVRMVFMIAAGSNQHSEYLKVLARLTGFLKNENLREKLLNASKPGEFFDILINGAQ